MMAGQRLALRCLLGSAGDGCTYVEPSEPMKATRFWTILADRVGPDDLLRARNNSSVGQRPSATAQLAMLNAVRGAYPVITKHGALHRTTKNYHFYTRCCMHTPPKVWYFRYQRL